MNKICRFILAISLLAVLTACASTSDSHSGASADIGVMSIDVISMGSRMKSGLLQAQIELKNSSSRKQSLKYRINWLDAGGEIVEKEFSHWEPLVIQADARHSISQIAPSTRVVKYKLIIEKAN